MPDEYKIRYYMNSQTGREPLVEYVENLEEKSRAKIRKYVEYLRYFLLYFYSKDNRSTAWVYQEYGEDTFK